MSQDTIIRTCSHCGTKNRIPISRLRERPLCGKCGDPLKDSIRYDLPVVVTDAGFKEEVLAWDGVVLVDCWAPWCGPCRMVAPILDELAGAYQGRAKIAKLNTDENPSVVSQYGIQSIPTMLFFKDGVLINRLVGAMPKAEIERNLRSVLGDL